MSNQIDELVRELSSAQPVNFINDDDTAQQFDPSSQVKRDTDDVYHIGDHLEKYMESFITLRKDVAQKLLYLLIGEIVVMFIVLFLVGAQLLSFDQWFIALFSESILIQTFLTVREIVVNLFPKSFIEDLAKLAHANNDR